jgi:hypothetical protein
MPTTMQIVGVGAVILPMLALFVGLGIASHRRRAAETSVYAAPPPPDFTP